MVLNIKNGRHTLLCKNYCYNFSKKEKTFVRDIQQQPGHIGCSDKKFNSFNEKIFIYTVNKLIIVIKFYQTFYYLLLRFSFYAVILLYYNFYYKFINNFYIKIDITQFYSNLLKKTCFFSSKFSSWQIYLLIQKKTFKIVL